MPLRDRPCLQDRFVLWICAIGLISIYCRAHQQAIGLIASPGAGGLRICTATDLVGQETQKRTDTAAHREDDIACLSTIAATAPTSGIPAQSRAD
jgi:hypothetical protein